MIHALDVKHLEVLQLLLENRTLADASVVLNASPPALTHRLREAERRLGVQLVEKSGRTLKLSSAGERMALAARGVLQVLSGAESDAQRLGRGVTQTCRITSTYYNTYPWLADVISMASRKAPGMLIEVVPEAAREAIEALERGRIDLAVMPSHLPPQDHPYVELMKDELVLLVPPGNELARHDYVDQDGLKKETLVTNSNVTVPGFETERFFVHGRHPPGHIYNLAHTDAMLQFVERGGGVAIAPTFVAATQISEGRLCAVRLTKHGLPMDWYAVLGKAPHAETAASLIAECFRRSDLHLYTRLKTISKRTAD